jgi:hypothetical protein
MTNAVPTLQKSASNSILDLSKVVGAEPLSDALFESIQELKLPEMPRHQHSSQAEIYRIELLLAILGYSYACNIFRSREIETRMLRKRGSGEFLDTTSLGWEEFSQFRKLYRDVLKDCLIRLFKKAAQFPDASNLHAPFLASDALIEEEVEHRLSVARELDSFDRDN